MSFSNSPPICPAQQLGYDEWCRVLWFVKRPRPMPGTAVSRKGWHQGDLAACVRVSKEFNAIASRLLYHDPIVTDFWSFSFGAEPDRDVKTDIAGDSVDGRCSTAARRISKTQCLSLVDRLFVELPNWSEPLPCDDWMDPGPYPELGKSASSSAPTTATASTSTSTSTTHPPPVPVWKRQAANPGAWGRRIDAGLAALTGMTCLRPSRVVFEAYCSLDSRRLHYDYEPPNIRVCASLRAMRPFVASLHAAYICAWTSQSLSYAVELEDNHTALKHKGGGGSRNPADSASAAGARARMTKHVEFQERFLEPLGNMTVRFRCPWNSADGRVLRRASRSKFDGYDRWIWKFTRSLPAYSRGGRDGITPLEDSEEMAQERAKGPMMSINVVPYLPAVVNPAHAHLMGPAAAGLGQGRETGAPADDTTRYGTDDIVCAAQGSAATNDSNNIEELDDALDDVSTDGLDADPFEVETPMTLEQYLEAWQRWCSKLSALRGGCTAAVSICDEPACPACGMPGPEWGSAESRAVLDQEIMHAAVETLGESMS